MQVEPMCVNQQHMSHLSWHATTNYTENSWDLTAFAKYIKVP